MIVLLSSATFFIVGVFLFLIGIVMMSDPRQMLTILRRMGSTPQIHFTELGLRFLAGAAFFIFAEQTPYARGFQIAGVFLMATSVFWGCCQS